MRWVEPGSFPWLTLHEVRLGFRSGPLTRRGKWIRLAFLALYAGLGIFLASLAAHVAIVPTARFLVFGSAVLLVLFTFMLTQSLLAGQRTLFTAGDLDLLLSSPLPEGRILSAKLLGVAGSAAATFSLLILPMALPIAVWGHPRLLAVVPILGSLALVAGALGIGLSILLVRLLGARGARSAGQILAALMGGLIFLVSQLSQQSGVRRSRFAAVAEWMQRTGWGIEGVSAWPARALFGEIVPLLGCAAVALAIFWIAQRLLKAHFLRSWQSAGDRSGTRPRREPRRRTAFASTITRAVVTKEIRLLSREPEILFMVLMRLIYLVPLIFVGLKGNHGADFQLAALGAVGAVAAGQLCGSLAWLTISAEDSPDLLAVSPVLPSVLRREKLNAALILTAPFALIVPVIFLVLAPAAAPVALVGAVAASWASGMVELLLGKPQKRSTFNRRRQGSFLSSLLGTLSALLIGLTTAAAIYFMPGV